MRKRSVVQVGASLVVASVVLTTCGSRSDGGAGDAATAIIKAMAVALKNAPDVESARQATVDAIGKSSFDGVTGHVAFDRFGDTTTRILTLNKVAGGRWVAQQTKDFGAR